MNPKISIITASFNNVETIEDTILSVINQSYGNIEYIIVDGKSTDGTLEMVEKFEDKIHKRISGKDNGIYDALNKGIDLATGEYIAFLHADDYYENNEVISKAVYLLEKSDADAVYGDLIYIDGKKKNKEKTWRKKQQYTKIKRFWNAGEYKENSFVYGWMPPHPTFIVKKEIYEKYGKFNLEFQSAADYELMLRFIHKEKIKTTYLPLVMVVMRTGGKSNKSLGNRLFANKEDKKAWLVNDLKFHWFTTILKPLRKISQWKF